jgi:Tfp pilus assembly protein PilF
MGSGFRKVRSFSIVSILLATWACSRGTGLPTPDSEQYRKVVAAFHVGLAGLQTGEDTRARQRLTEATQLAPNEPASWANLGLLNVRHQEFDAAYENVERARRLAPGNSAIEVLLGQIEAGRGNLAESVAHFKKAIELDPGNLRALYALAQETERQSADTSDAEAQQLLEKLLAAQPGNLAVLLDLARLSAKRGDGATLKRTLASLSEKSGAWPEQAKEQMAGLQKEAATDLRAAAVQVAFLRNLLTPSPDFRQSLNAVKTPVEFVGEPFLKFLALPSPNAQPAPADLATNFTAEEVAGVEPANLLDRAAVVVLDAEKAPQPAFYGPNQIQIAGGPRIPIARNARSASVLPLDYNYDFKTDLVAATSEGLRIFRQGNDGAFQDATAASGLPARLTSQSHRGVWSLDFDLDGDLDVLLSPDSAQAEPVVLRNSGEGRFAELRPFRNLRGLHSAAVADIDGDGDPDLAVGDQQGFTVFLNERLGQYRESAILQPVGAVSAIAAADINGDGSVDFLAHTRDQRLLRVSWTSGERLESAEVARLPASEAGGSLLVADLDNNGALDLVGAASVLLGDAQGAFTLVNLPQDARIDAVVDVNADGRLDLIGMQGPAGGSRPVQFLNRGARNYRYQRIRTRAAQATGDQRINSFGIGGEIEIRSGLLTQKQIVSAPVLHFGLGENLQTDVARIVWPNGSVQAEFELQADQSVLAAQRLKGSCPMLFAWDGKQLSYVKDTAPWSPALGLRINAQATADVYQTEEWFKIRGDQLKPRDGFYDLRVTAELWEVYYIDHYSLLAVDHPEGTEVFSDERFALPPPPLKLYATSSPEPFASARDDRGEDVSKLVDALDRKYLGTFGKGAYQGVTRDHWVELELPDAAPTAKPLYLVGHGFLHPTDGSINVAYSQTGGPPPAGLTMETPDAAGRWSVARPGLGFPAGKLKTVVIGLDGVFKPGAARKLRLRTNMEIYWDQLEWAESLPDATFKTQRIELESADLRWRGFSRFTQADDSSPELPDYNDLVATTPKWRDLIGFFTRHGEVKELLAGIDGRMVIVNAGDEIRLQFPELPPPPTGWTRDFVMVGDGWIKDGDLNSTFSKTVQPLPYRGIRTYVTPPGKLEDETAYRRNPDDWQIYHTRYVTPDHFRKALRN